VESLIKFWNTFSLALSFNSSLKHGLTVNDSIGLVPMGFAKTKADKLAEYLDIEIHFTAISNTRLVGALSVMNNKGILLPTTAYQNEYDYLKKETDLEVGVLDTKFNALGNVICANDKGAVVSPWLSKEDCQTISDVLGVETVQKRIAGFNQVGSVMVANDSGAAIHPEANEEDMKMFANVLGVKIEQSSMNNGIPYVSSGILANNHSLVVGSLTTGPEIMMLTRAFLN
jgi:translation initiation factor 6